MNLKTANELDAQLQWESGTLSSHTMKRVAADALADMWQDCYRRDESGPARHRRFCEQVMNALYIATGESFRVE